MKPNHTPLLPLLALLLGTAVQAAEPSPRDLRAAQCVAALDLNTQALARKVKAGNAAAKPQLLDQLIAGAAFMGDSFVHGNHDEDQSRRLADQAREAQKKLSPAELAARQAGCAAEGSKLYASSNVVQRAVVKRLAKKRMDNLLAGDRA